MIQIKRSGKIVKATIPLTPSKSITNRALIIRALSENKFDINNISTSSDSEILKEILENLPDEIDVKDAGTTFRFLTSYLSITEGTHILTGNERMKNRPVGGLVKALRSIGAEIEFIERENYPPIKIKGKKLSGGAISIDASESSQFISSLLLIAPVLTGGLKLILEGKINSRPYIVMTLSLLQFFGIAITAEENCINIKHQKYVSRTIRIENDWSSASFWYEVAAFSDYAEITLQGLFRNSIQGDSVIDEIMKNFGVQSEVSGNEILISKIPEFKIPEFFKYDFSSCPDLVIPVAIVCAGLNIRAEFTGVRNLRIKESNRLLSLKNELFKISTDVTVGDDFIIINPSSSEKSIEIFHSHNDHRMVMSIAPLSLLYDEINIDDHLPVNKSYPEFWRQMRAAGFSCELI